MADVRFCTSCQCRRDVEGGVYRKLKNGGRWICKPCVEHKSDSIYKNTSGKPVDVQRLMTQLYERAGR